jgi:hypothetical protein
MTAFKTRSAAIEAACGMLDHPVAADIEVGPMLDPIDGNVLRQEQLRRARKSIRQKSQRQKSVATPVADAWRTRRH